MIRIEEIEVSIIAIRHSFLEPIFMNAAISRILDLPYEGERE